MTMAAIRAVGADVEEPGVPLQNNSAAAVVPLPLRQEGAFVQLRVERVSGEVLRFSSGTTGRRALSCLAEPKAGDEVLVWRTHRGEAVVTAVLTRKDNGGLSMAPCGGRQLQISAQGLSLAARDDLSLVAGRDCAVSTPRGNIALSARNILQSTTQALLQCVGDWLLRAQNVSVTSEQTVQIHAKRQLITADKELKLDGEIIHMG